MIGVGVAAAAGAASMALRAYGGKQAGGAASVLGKSFYRGGFEAKMTKREAALILGVRETANKDKIKEAHRRIMLANHPDRGGSPYMASKINEVGSRCDEASSGLSLTLRPGECVVDRQRTLWISSSVGALEFWNKKWT